MCECCDHPLQHAIRQAINARPYLSARMILDNLESDLQMWEDEQ